jgi:hypothetical protein
VVLGWGGIFTTALDWGRDGAAGWWEGWRLWGWVGRVV